MVNKAVKKRKFIESWKGHASVKLALTFCFCSMKQLHVGVFLLPPDGMLVHHKATHQY